MNRIDVPVGISDFKKIREGGYYYIDKTDLVRKLLMPKPAEVTLLTRPRRFGKTLGMSMLAFGFSQTEVDKLLKDTGLRDHTDEMREWYDGYRFGNMDVYCPWDVVNHVNRLLM